LNNWLIQTEGKEGLDTLDLNNDDVNWIIPIAGKGKRLRPHSLSRPKPLFPVAGKPVVARLMETLHKISGKPDNVVFVVSPWQDTSLIPQIVESVVGSEVNVHIRVQEKAEGTAHAIYQAGDLLNGPVMIAFGDTIFKPSQYVLPEADGAIWTYRVEDPSSYGVVLTDQEGIITGMVEKPDTPISHKAIIGVYYVREGQVLKKHIEHLIENNIRGKGNEFQLTDALEMMVKEGLKLVALPVSQWLDTGNHKLLLNALKTILTEEGTHISKDAILKNCTIINPVYIGPYVHIEDSVIGPHTAIEEGTQIDNSVLKESVVLENCKIENIVANHSVIGENSVWKRKMDRLILGPYSVWE